MNVTLTVWDAAMSRYLSVSDTAAYNQGEEEEATTGTGTGAEKR